MDNLLKEEIVGILNTIQRGDAPKAYFCRDCGIQI